MGAARIWKADCGKETRVTTIEERTKNKKTWLQNQDVADLKTAIEKANVWALCGTVGGFALLSAIWPLAHPKSKVVVTISWVAVLFPCGFLLPQVRLSIPAPAAEWQRFISCCFINVFYLEFFDPLFFQREYLASDCLFRIRTRDARPLGQSPPEISQMRQVQPIVRNRIPRGPIPGETLRPQRATARPDRSFVANTDTSFVPNIPT